MKQSKIVIVNRLRETARGLRKDGRTYKQISRALAKQGWARANGKAYSDGCVMDNFFPAGKPRLKGVTFPIVIDSKLQAINAICKLKAVDSEKIALIELVSTV